MNPHEPIAPEPDDVAADDVLISAYIDGEVTEAEAARVEGDPRLLARASGLRQVAESVSGEVTPNPARRDAAITAALGAAGFAADDPPTKELPVTRLDDHRERRQRGLRIASIAAAVLLVVLVAVPVIRSFDNGASDEQATVADTAESIDEKADADAADGASGQLEEASPLSPPRAEPLQPVELGNFGQAEDARHAVDEELQWILVPAAGQADDSPLSGYSADLEAAEDRPRLTDPCPGILAHQSIDGTALVWWGRYAIEDAVHDFIVFERTDASDADSLHGFIEVTTNCRIVETGTLDPG